MNVLSLFDGMSCGRIALERAGIKVDNYFSSEIDKYAIQVADKNYPQDTKNRLGNICDIEVEDVPNIDLLIGGSPCQGFSFAGKQLNFDDERSKLFFEYVRLLEELKPKYFLLENVKMTKESEAVISELLGVDPIMINSNLLTAQNRRRLYWTNIPGIEQPVDKNISLKEVLQEEWSDNLNLSDKAFDYMSRLRNGKPRWHYHSNKLEGKASCLTANMFKGIPYGVIQEQNRRLTPIECERLQTVPDNYTDNVSNTQRYKMIGNGWTVDVIAHIFKGLRNDI